MKQYHNQQISEEAALTLVFAYLDQEDIDSEGIRFTGTTGRGLCEYRKNRKIKIRLPAEKTRKLTVGITLHEVAHALAFIDHGAKKHCDIFVRVLDNLAESEVLCKSRCL